MLERELSQIRGTPLTQADSVHRSLKPVLDPVTKLFKPVLDPLKPVTDPLLAARAVPVECVLPLNLSR